MTFSPLYLLPLAPLAFIAFWCLLVKGLALAGWQRLATHFQVPELPPGKQFSLTDATVSGIRYKNAIMASVSGAGLGLRTGFPFRIGHEPLLIPWAALSALKAEKTFWFTTYSTTVQAPSGSTISLRFGSEEVVAAARPWLPLA